MCFYAYRITWPNKPMVPTDPTGFLRPLPCIDFPAKRM